MHGLLKNDEGYGGEREAAAIVAAFPDQPLDFFGAARSRCVDDAVRAWLASVGTNGMGEALMSHRVRSAQGGGGLKGEAGLAAEAGRSRNFTTTGHGYASDNVSSSSSSSSDWSSLLAKSDVSHEALMRAAVAVAQEQQNVMDLQLARDYVKNWSEAPTAEEIRMRRREERAREDIPEEVLMSATGGMGRRAAAEAAAAEAARPPEALAAAAPELVRERAMASRALALAPCFNR